MGNAYLQISLIEKAKQKTAFITPDGMGQFNRMMCGLCNAPYEFTRLMSIVFGPLRRDFLRWYLDDILIAVRDWEEMLCKLERVLKAIQRDRLTLKLKECYFAQKSVEYMGYILSQEGLRPGSKTKAIEYYPTFVGVG